MSTTPGVEIFRPREGSPVVVAIGTCGYCGKPRAFFINRNGSTRCLECNDKDLGR